MASHIPENILEDILSRVDITEIIAGYIPVKKAGRNFRALCPFHHEKTPSFMVSPDRQIYHCFGCGEGGNVFNFIMQYEHLEFLEAVQMMAAKAGVSLPESSSPDSKKESLNTQLYQINELACLFYESTLRTPEAAVARKYAVSRGFSEEFCRRFRIGYASERWDGLINYLRSKDVSLALMEKAGLVISKEGGGYYDRFRGRLIFPIFDVKSRVVAFGARKFLEAKGEKEVESPKYINSPETFIYIKGKHLYGLNFSRDAIHKKDLVVVVEGYLDFLTPFSAGFEPIVASSGTALTLDQIRLIKRYSHNVVMIYDGDEAGQMAMLRVLDSFIEEELNVKLVSLPDGLDPDSFVRQNGIESFRQQVQAALPIFDFKLNILKHRFDAHQIEGKAKIASEMLLSLSKFKNALIKTEYVRKLAGELQVNEEALFEELKKVKLEKNPDVSVKVAQEVPINPTEKLLIKLMLDESRLIERLRQELEPADFMDTQAARIVQAMFELSAQGKILETSSLLEHLGDAHTRKILCESALMPEVDYTEKEKIVDDCILRLKSNKVTLKRKNLHEQIRQAQSLGDKEKLDKLMDEFHHLTKER